MRPSCDEDALCGNRPFIRPSLVPIPGISRIRAKEAEGSDGEPGLPIGSYGSADAAVAMARLLPKRSRTVVEIVGRHPMFSVEVAHIHAAESGISRPGVSRG